MRVQETWPLGVCSWSLQSSVPEMAAILDDLALTHIHLAVGPALDPATGAVYLQDVRKQAWTISATMIEFPQEDYSTLDTIRATGGVAPDEVWPSNRDRFAAACEVTASLGGERISMHAGFLDHDDAAYARKFYERIRDLAAIARTHGLKVLLETGQESAVELRRFMEELSDWTVGINFDPANMILYEKGDPVDAVRVLAPWVGHVHIKDANRTTVPGTWGEEVPWGTGQVPHGEFLETLQAIGYSGTLAIEREAGDDRVGDVRIAIDSLTGSSAPLDDRSGP